MKTDFKSLRFRLWLYLMLFAVGIMGLLWLLQTVWSGSFYRESKLRAINSATVSIHQSFAVGEVDKIQNTVDTLAYSIVGFIDIRDIRGKSIYSADAIGFQALNNIEDINLNAFNERMAQQGNRLTATVGRNILHGEVVSTQTGENFLLYIFCPADPAANSATLIMRNMLFYISIMVIMLAALFSMFISLGISSPIVRMTRQAMRLAQGDYDVKFQKSGYSEITQLADTLDYAARELGQVEGMRKDLIANVSHDLRTPLTMIKAYAEMIRDISGDNPEKRNEHIAVIINESDRMSEMVSDMLELSKYQAGTVKLQMAPMDINGIIKSVVHRFALYPKTSQYHLEYDDPGPVWVVGDASALERVVYNLLNNAITYTGKDKTVRLRMTLYQGWARVEIADSGAGIPEDKLESIWNRYTRLDSKRAHATTGGTGLGLYIVKTIMDGHGGRYGVASREGEGSVFWFAVPLVGPMLEAKN